MDEFIKMPPEMVVMAIYDKIGVKLTMFSIYIMCLDGFDRGWATGIKTIN